MRRQVEVYLEDFVGALNDVNFVQSVECLIEQGPIDRTFEIAVDLGPDSHGVEVERAQDKIGAADRPNQDRRPGGKTRTVEKTALGEVVEVTPDRADEICRRTGRGHVVRIEKPISERLDVGLCVDADPGR